MGPIWIELICGCKQWHETIGWLSQAADTRTSTYDELWLMILQCQRRPLNLFHWWPHAGDEMTTTADPPPLLFWVSWLCAHFCLYNPNCIWTPSRSCYTAAIMRPWLTARGACSHSSGGAGHISSLSPCFIWGLLIRKLFRYRPFDMLWQPTRSPASEDFHVIF